MKKRVYVETTIVSYLTAKPSRDLIMAGNQELTREWWDGHRHRYDLCTSQFVLDEAAQGDADATEKRLLALRGIPLLAPPESAIAIARALLANALLPSRAATDALHLALATVHGLDVLLTWNCRHLANASMLVDIGRFLRVRGHDIPVVCTPNELMDDPRELEESS